MSLSTPIFQVIDRDPVTIDVGQKVSEALRILTSGRIHHLPVVAEGTLVGVLSTTDMLVLRASALISDDPESVHFVDRHYVLEDVMTRDPITVSARATIADAARQLSAGGFHALPVVETGNRLVGIVTTTDLIGHMLEAPPKLDLPHALKGRLRVLEQVRRTAEAFVHSGLAGTEQSHLEAALEAAREAEPGDRL
jgi:CBS domain-containing protein